MIQLTFDVVTGVARLASPGIIKTGAPIAVQIVFSVAVPEEGTLCQLALGTDAAPPAVLAVAEDFARVNATTYQGTLDAADARLLAFMAGKNSAQVNAELTCQINGNPQVAPNLMITVQPAIA